MPGARHRGSFHGRDYTYLDHADAADLAWEWLRREPAYRKLTPSSPIEGPFGCKLFQLATPELQQTWGCLNIARSDGTAAETQLLWSATADPWVLSVAALPPGPLAGTAFDLAEWGDRVTIVAGSHAEHVLIRSRRGQLRLDVCNGTILHGPVRLFVDLTPRNSQAQCTARLDWFRDALLHDNADRIGPRRDRAHGRQIAALRTFDALAEGASIRDVAIVLFGEARVRADWLDPGESLKSTCRRLIVLARRMGDGGYRSLLDPACYQS